MIPVHDIEPLEVVAILETYQGLTSHIYNEAICASVPCSTCGAQIGQLCIGQRGNPNYSLHCERRMKAEAWRKMHREDWKVIKRSAQLKLVTAKHKEIVAEWERRRPKERWLD